MNYSSNDGKYVHKLVLPKSFVTVSEDVTFPDFDELVVVSYNEIENDVELQSIGMITA